MYGLQDGEQALHQKAAPRRVERDEEDGNVRGPTPEIVDPTESRPRSRNRAQDRGISVVISAVA